MTDAHGFEHRGDTRGDLLARDTAPVLQRIGDVLGHGHVRPQPERLEHHPEIAPLGRLVDAVGHRRKERAGEEDLAFGRILEPADAAQQRGLAAAAGPEQHEHLRARHVEIDAIEREHVGAAAS